MEPEFAVAVVTVLYPVQGHLSLLLASRELSIHFAAPETHLRGARARLHGGGSLLAAVHFRALEIPAHAVAW